MRSPIPASYRRLKKAPRIDADSRAQAARKQVLMRFPAKAAPPRFRSLGNLIVNLIVLPAN